MIRIAGTAVAVASIVALAARWTGTAYRLGHKDGWHKGVARGVEMEGEIHERCHAAQMADKPASGFTLHDQVPVGAMLPEDWFRA